MASMIAKTKTGIGKKATRITDHEGQFFVELYTTLVYSEDSRRVVLRNGGWNTPMTKQRINSALIYRGFAPGISTTGGNMSYRGIPFVDGSLVLTIAQIRKIKVDHDVEIEKLISEAVL